MNNKTIILISDYGTGDPAFVEVMLKLRMLIPDVFLLRQSTPPFSTLNTGFWIYQYAMTPHIRDTFIYSNTAPRKASKTAQRNNAGEKLMYAKLSNGFEIMAVNAGFAFSFVKPNIRDFRFVNVPNEGSQFRSRDIYPIAVAQMVNNDPTFIGARTPTESIPDVPKNRIASIDGYGNIKTTTRRSQVTTYRPGQKLLIKVRNQKHLTTYTDGTFNIEEGELAFAPGSSGHNDRFMELFLRGGNAYQQFQKPDVEEEFSLIPLS